jgi:hypothetical protein
LDVEIKFTLGSVLYSIDVHKKHIEELKDLYKALLTIAEISRENEFSLEYAKQSLELASATLSRISSNETDIVERFKELNDVAFSWLMDTRKKYNVKDFGYVFERYINN